MTTWTAPHTWTVGEYPTAAQFNSNIRDNLLYLKSRVLTGRINSDGTIAGGTGFTVSKTGTGTYTVSFTASFSAAPVVLITPLQASGQARTVIIVSVATNEVHIQTCDGGGGGVGGATDAAFHFIAREVT